ncbi:MAG TPA: polysaccharide biosynthesis C-terminal domain-containing protein, partial [Steroidobacteraceae bacterium]
YSAFVALDRPQVFVRINAIYVCVLLVLLASFTPFFGIQGAAWAYVITVALVLPATFYYITRFLGLAPISLVGQVWRPLCGAGVMYVVVRLLGPALPHASLSGFSAAASLAWYVALGVPTYVLTVAALWVASGKPAASAEAWAARRIQSFATRAWGVLARRGGEPAPGG